MAEVKKTEKNILFEKKARNVRLIKTGHTTYPIHASQNKKQCIQPR